MQHELLSGSRAAGGGEPAFRRIAGDAARGLLVLCDHASNALPAHYGTLGLPPRQLERHIAYDIGAGGVAEGLAKLLGAPALLTRYSRLLIDPNRGADDPTLVMRLSDGAVIPGNAAIDAAEIERRVAHYHAPYHAAIDAAIDMAIAAGRPPVLVSIHSFTEAWKGAARPWQVTVLWDRDPRLARPLLEALRAEPAVVVGENEPYSGKLKNDTLYRHGTHRGLAHALVEIRQDLIREAAGQHQWAERLAGILDRLLDCPAAAPRLHVIDFHGSHADQEGPDEPPARPMHREPQKGTSDMKQTDKQTATELEAAAFRRLVEHLRDRADVQNIDMMDLAGFCRNCLSNWYQEAAAERGVQLSKEDAREIVYGMPYEEWKAKHQSEASPDQQRRFETARREGGH